MTEEVESFGGSRWEVQYIKVLAGWPAKPQTPCRLWSPALPRYPPRLRKKVPSSFQRPPQRSESEDLGRKGQLHFFKRIENLYGPAGSRHHQPMATHCLQEAAHPQCEYPLQANETAKRTFIYSFQNQLIMVAKHAFE